MSDFHFTSTQPIKLGTTTDKYQGNLEAIRILKRCTTENRPATPDEQETLSRYVGWGDSAILRHLTSSEELRSLLTNEELKAARSSSLNAHYTALPVIGAIWEALTHLGFDSPDLRILDPSAGIGHFKSAAPQALRGADWVEIELDSLTAGILRLLHPQSQVYAQGYETVDLPDDWFDLAVSNVPFGDYGVASRKLPAHLRAAIHDFFFANTVSLLRPGGVMAFITSRYTLDKKEPQVRQWLARHLDLLAAVRLPCSAFKANAGTEVVTDILIMQKRLAGAWQPQTPSGEPEWVQTVPVEVKGKYLAKKLPLNAYYAHHPEMVLGRPSLTGTMYGSDGYNVEPDGRGLGEAIREVFLGRLPKGWVGTTEAPVIPKLHSPVEILTTASARFSMQEARLQGLHEIYRAAKALLVAETEGRLDAEVSRLRSELNQVYDRFLDTYGPVNCPANTRLLANSVEMPFLKALEIYDPLSATARKGGIFSGSLVWAAIRAETTSVEDALLICLDQRGKVDMDFIAGLACLPQVEAVRQLGDRVFRLPAGGWETRDAYLSGNVREKLRQAQAAAAFDPGFERNVSALLSSLPEALKPFQIRAPLGAGWIPADVVEAFLYHLLTEGRYTVTYVAGLAHWEVEAQYIWQIPTGLAFSRWGTGRVHALDLIDDGLNARTPVVYDITEVDGQEVRLVNQVETVAAQAKLAEIKAEFERWLWGDPERAERLAAIYNERFNAYQVRQYDGAHLSTPGLNRAITLRPHQKNAIWRILQNRATLLAHEVGMGKTLTGITAAMESRRLRMTRKAMVVVPNHLTAQWSDQALWAYPNANVLAASPSDLSKANRGVFMSCIAANDWDLVIVPFSSFKLLPVSPATLREFYQREIDRLEEYLWELKADKASARAIKEIEKSLKRFRVRLENSAAMAKDSAGTITWEELGVDLLMVDEFHCLPYESRVLTNQGWIPIGEIVENKLPVLVKSVDLSTNTVKWMPVTGWFNNRQTAPMVRVEHENGVFECTANHKVWTEENGYVEAGKLTTEHTLKCLPGLRERIYTKQQRHTWAKSNILLQDLLEEQTTQDRNEELRTVREGIHLSINWKNQQRQTPFLRYCLRSYMAHGTARAKGTAERISPPYVGCLTGGKQGKTFSGFLRSNEGQQPQSNAGVETEDVGDYVWPNFPSERWKWNNHPSTGSSGNCIGAANGVCYTYSSRERSVQIAADQLQGRCCRSGPETGYRDRWENPSDQEVEVFGQTEDGGLGRSRVVRVAFLESESGFRSAVRAGRDQRVYCLEVAGTHNFFAEGVLVSNCFKNLFFSTRMTRIAGLSNSDSQRAFDMFVKMRWTQQRGGKVVGMTGTPVTNTIAEMYTMQRYFQMETLEALGLAHFDAWANQFALAESGLEMTPDGAGFRMNTRFRKFVNLPELMQLWRQVVDTERIDERSGIDRPDLYHGRPVKVIAQGGPDLKDYTLSLAARAERVRSGMVTPQEDNMLKITGDGRKAALDLSLVVPSPPGVSMPKIDALVEVVSQIYTASTPTRGVQVIFCDLATPKART